MRTLNKLSAISAAKMKGAGRHSDGGGLYLNVTKSGTKSWLFMWTIGKRKEMGLGPFPAVSLADARLKANECRKHVAAGRSPISERDRLTEKSFGECALEYISTQRTGWRNAKHAAQWESTLTTYCKTIWEEPVSAVTLEKVSTILAEFWLAKNETASRVRGRIERVLDYAATKGWRTGENPARWRGNLENILPKRQLLQRGHMAAMDYGDVPAFLKRTKASSAISTRALEFVMLTATRSGEVLGARWEEFDLVEGIWTIPANRMKANKQHQIPLSKQALAILEPLNEAGVSDYVFPGQNLKRPLSNMAMTQVLRRFKIENATVHGFRSSFRDWCGDQTEYAREIAEEALAHQIGNAVERAYRRGNALEKRRNMMQDWADYCFGTITR